MDWSQILEYIKHLLPSLHSILHYFDNLIHSYKPSNRELEFVYSSINSTDAKNDVAIELLNNLIKKTN